MRTKRAFLAFVAAVVLPALLLLAAEGSLRLWGYPYPRPLFVPSAIKLPGRDLLEINRWVAERYFSRFQFVPEPPYEIFLKVKPRNGYRIFVLGDSTAAGWPYPNNGSFARILRQRLADAFPEREIEVVNISIAAVNSYTLLDLLDEVLEQKPDALLIYTGHNEFYGALGPAATGAGGVRPVVKLYLALARFRTVAALRDGWNWVQNAIARSKVPGTLMAKMIGKSSVPLGSPTYRQGREQFEGNLRDILRQAKAAGLPVLISEVVSNLRDHAPFVSQAYEGLPAADEVYKEARALEAENRFSDARQAYYRAKDLDAMRFRASEEFNEIIHRVAAEQSVPVVPMKDYFEKASPNRLIGANLMLEHLHPNVEGQFLMSEAFLDAMRRNGFIAPNWDEARLKPLDYYRANYGISDLDRALANMRVMDLTDRWPFKPTKQGSDAVRKYEPKDRNEEVARGVFTANVTLRSAHLIMAEQYLNDGKPEKALMEYRALVATGPYELDNYLESASVLAEHGRYRDALPFLEQSLTLKETAFAYQGIGQVLLIESRVAEAVPFLEKALMVDSPNPVLLSDLTNAYLVLGMPEKAKVSLYRLSRQFPGHPSIENLQQRMAAAAKK